MRKIDIMYWKAKTPDGNEVEENTVTVLNMLINSMPTNSIPRGLDSFRLFNRISKAFKKSEEKKVLVLEESDHSFLVNAIKNDIPSVWGTNENILKAVDSVINAKEE